MTDMENRNVSASAGRPHHPRALAMFLLIALLVAAADLVVKSQAFEHVAGRPVEPTAQNATDPDLIPPHPPVTVVPHLLSLKLVLNRGAVFGIGAGGQVLFIAITIIAIGAIGVIFWRSPARQCLMHTALALILGGAVGNLYDRITITMVRDMLYLFPGVRLPWGLKWPGGDTELYPWIFNIADASLVLGVGLIMLMMLRKRPA